MNFKKLLPHLLVIVGFAVLALFYASPSLNGKVLIQHDPVQAAGGAKEIIDFHAKTGEWPWWTNSMFGGMPAYFVGGHHLGSIFTYIAWYYNPLPGGITNMLFWCLLGAYILFIILELELWLAVLGAIAYTFATLNLLWIEAGHVSKVYSLAFAPMMIAGVLLAFRGKKLAGGVLFALAFGLEINANHVQINYYTAIGLGIIVLVELYKSIKEKTVKNFISALIFVGIGGILALASNSARLWTTYEYSKESTRSKSELTSNPKAASGGLDKDYAFSGSLAKQETMTLLIPKFMGGASLGEFDTKSKTYNALISNGVPAENASQIIGSLPSYWGDQGIMTGSIYAGAIVIFLFVLGLLLSKNRYKISFGIVAIFFLMLAWGKNLPVFSDLMFDYFPMYNKFRDVKMILSLQQLFMVGVGIFGIKTLIDTKPSFAEIKKPFLISLGITGGLCLIFALLPSLFVSFSSESDQNLVQQLSQSFGNQQVAQSVLNSIIEDRASLMQGDAWRSLIFILIAAAAIWAFVQNKINAQILTIALTLFVTVDLVLVDKRYVNKDDFKPKVRTTDELFQPTVADTEILKDKDLSYRVIDLPGGVFSDGRPSYFHKSIGGYHGAKMRRYQEVVDNQLSKQLDAFYTELRKENLTQDIVNQALSKQTVLNILNTRYVVINPEAAPIRNPYALGNGWFVSNVKVVANADEEIKELGSFNPKQTVLIDKRYEEFVKGKSLQADSSATIKLTEYQPNKLVYESDSKTEQVAVFSEMYYRGNQDWVATIDGKEAPHFRADYLLRGMVVPAGKHKIEFKFAPASVTTGKKIDMFASIALVICLIGAIFMEIRKKD
ncbi:MAG: hypothetical protein ACK4NY_14830 [Spirosomataceae bacterium]